MMRAHLIPHAMGVWMIIVIGLLSLNWSDALFLSRELPCRFLDSIDITDGALQNDKSIVFNNITYTKDQYATINYIMENGTNRIAVDPYIRGCICNRKACIRLCCPHGTFVDTTIKQGKKCRNDEAAKELEAQIIDEHNQVKTVILDDYFAYVDDRPCSKFYLAEAYKIMHTGIVLHENARVTHRQYCLRTSLNAQTQKPKLDMAVCYKAQDQPNTRYNILPYGMLLSVPFILATILVYLCLPELLNLHGKCLLCYLSALVIGYTAMALVQLNGANYVEPVLCKSVGYLIYFSFIMAFLWLSVISFDLWWNFRTTGGFQRFTERTRFILYILYALGLSLLVTFIVFILDSTQLLPEHLRPGVGAQTCFLKKSIVSQFVIFYMPLSIICTVNIVFFVLTALKIRQVQQDLKKVTSKDETSRHQSKFNKDKDNFTLYLRLFIVMGVTWSMEAISFFISAESDFFLLTDICNTIQGVLIFVLFVMKRRIFRLIKKRWQGLIGKATTNGSVATNSTSATYAPSHIVLNQITSPNEKSKGSC